MKKGCGPYKEWNAMELELDRTQRSGYEAVLDTTVCREETLESIVPDACPDILRICDTEGVVCLRDKVLQDGRVELSGSVRAALLYLPDGEEGIRRMEVELPFSSVPRGSPAAGTGGRRPADQPPQGAGPGGSGFLCAGLCPGGG